MTNSIFDVSPRSTKVGGIVPGTNPYRRNEDQFFRDWYIQNMYDPDIHSIEDLQAGKYIVPYEGELIKVDSKTGNYIERVKG